MYNYCTLFDSNYLARGLAMQESLARHSKNFHLYIFAFDALSLDILKNMSLQNTTIISLGEFESDELLEIKRNRSIAEYCWTCTPSTIKHCIETFSLDHCTYIDADLFFYADPKILVDEMNEKSVLITEHRFTPIYDQSATSGIFCVQFITFKNDTNGQIALNWWQTACNEWCYNRFEDGKFGDQKYLDTWPDRFQGIHILQHEGGGIAPWNIQQYHINKNLVITNKKKKTQAPLIFYHYHHLNFHSRYIIDMDAYHFTRDFKSIISDYIEHIITINKKLVSINRSKSNYLATSYKVNLWDIFFSLRNAIKNNSLIIRKY